jgi:hypothetical protein
MYLEYDVKKAWLGPIIFAGRTHILESMLLVESGSLEKPF